jgi:anhydro-N-acetylmuramic acid kinase
MDAYETILDLRRRPRRRVLGLISGTSADGVTAVIADFTGTGVKATIDIGSYRTYPYLGALREEVFSLFDPRTSSVDRVCLMNFVLGEFFADCALRLISEEGLSPGEVDLIGSHGQTIYHIPETRTVSGIATRSTLQIGEPVVIAERTGIPTIADFRKADIAAGGEGAPLTPYLDYVLHGGSGRSLVLQNIGGIANLTHIPAGASPDDVVAFDTGPGNMIIDAIVKLGTGGRLNFDVDGALASEGEVSEELLARLLSHPYYARRPPKTTGREAFGEQYARSVMSEGEALGLGLEDLVATVSALTVESIARAYEKFLEGGIDGVYVSGGGAMNPHLMESLRARMEPLPVMRSEGLGVPSEAKEALLMALLANEHVMGTPSNLPRATGAGRAVVLGSLHPSSRIQR